MAVTADFKFALTAEETLTGIAGASTSKIDYSQFEVSGRLNATSTPPATKVYYGTITATGSSTGTLDLTSLTGPLGSTITALGLKLQMIRLTSLAASAGDFELGPGASNGYPLPTYAIKPGESVMQLFNDRLDDVASGDKTLDWNCDDACQIQVTFIFG
jgi:hypothetical protein